MPSIALYRSVLWFPLEYLTWCAYAPLTREKTGAQTHQRGKEGRNLSNNKPNRRVRVRAIRRDPPDVQKLGKALLALAIAQAQVEAEAQAEHVRQVKEGRDRAA
jgi:hypothetical protein